MQYFTVNDLKDLWDDSSYSQENYEEPIPTDEVIAAVEAALGGYKLPASYIELMRLKNGFSLQRDFFKLANDDDFADACIWVSDIMGIGFEKRYALCGEIGSQFMIEEWGYPEIGICFASTPSAGHEMYMLDYRECGKAGIPKVVHVDQEGDYEITPIADTFEDFIKGLVIEEEAFEDSLDK